MLQPGDVLVVAGKGHETGQIVGAVTAPFSDQDAIAAAIAGQTLNPVSATHHPNPSSRRRPGPMTGPLAFQ